MILKCKGKREVINYEVRKINMVRIIFDLNEILFSKAKFKLSSRLKFRMPEAKDITNNSARYDILFPYKVVHKILINF